MTAKRRILVVDDNKMALRLTTHLFEKAGYEVDTALNGVDGLAKAIDTNPDLVILDVMMPDMSGLEVCQKIRANPSTATLPVIMLSAKGRVDDKLSGFQAGADDYVQKPVEPMELLARAGALLERTKRIQPAARRAQIIGITGTKGGVGVTTLAVNVATVLANQGESVVLVELRAYPGTVAHNLNLKFSQDLSSLLAMNPADISVQDVGHLVGQHKSKLRALLAPQQATEYPLTTGHVKTIIDILASEYEYIVLDLPQVASQAIHQALDMSDQILLVTEPEPISVACTRTDLELLRTWGVLNRTNLVVISRVRSETLIARAKIEEQLGVPVVSFLPPTSQIFSVAASVGEPVVTFKPDTLVASTLIKLVRKLTEQDLVAVT